MTLRPERYARDDTAALDSRDALSRRAVLVHRRNQRASRNGIGSYCNDPEYCPGNFVPPYSRERYLITQLDSSLAVEWQYLNSATQSCERQDDGSLFCVEDHPNGFEWCVNAIAIDARGVIYANSEDGYLYAIAEGRVVQRLFLRAALGERSSPGRGGSFASLLMNRLLR